MIAQVAALGLLAIALGSIVFHAAVLTPCVFRLLPIEAARPFMRALLPDYYLFCGALSGVAAGLLLLPPGAVLGGVLVALVSASFFMARRELLPRLDMMREDGNSDGYDQLQRASVVLNTAQMAVLTAVFLQLLLQR